MAVMPVSPIAAAPSSRGQPSDGAAADPNGFGSLLGSVDANRPDSGGTAGGKPSGGSGPPVAAGTSQSAPTWAGIMALADQYAKRHLGFVNPAIYQIARSSKYNSAFHDVVAGPSNFAKFHKTTVTGYHAGPGWDPVTGWGSPNAQVLVPLLAQYSLPSGARN